MTNTKIKVGEYFYTKLNRSYSCCDGVQYEIYCEAHDEPQGCEYCDFDSSLPCECEA